MNFKKLLACWLCGCAAVVLAQTTSGVLESGGARIEVLGHSYAGLVPIGARQSRVVVYSLEDVRLAGATSIFVNGTYHASLIGGAYSELCYSPGEVELGARQMQVGQRAKDRPDAITALQLRGGQTHYLRVRERGGRPVLEPVAAAQAERELPAKRLQLHTLSRVAQECVVVNEAVQAEPSRHTLPADTLFAFARSDRAGMSAAGLGAIEQIVGGLRKDYTYDPATGTLTPSSPLSEGAHQISYALTDAAGNTSAPSAPMSLTVDSTAPTMAITSNQASLSAGQTATITFTLSEASSDFVWNGSAGDIAVTGGSLSALTKVSDTVYTATFTPNANSTTAGVIGVASGKFSDATGNFNSDGAEANNTVTLSVNTVTSTFSVANDSNAVSEDGAAINGNFARR